MLNLKPRLEPCRRSRTVRSYPVQSTRFLSHSPALYVNVHAATNVFSLGVPDFPRSRGSSDRGNKKHNSLFTSNASRTSQDPPVNSHGARSADTDADADADQLTTYEKSMALRWAAQCLFAILMSIRAFPSHGESATDSIYSKRDRFMRKRFTAEDIGTLLRPLCASSYKKRTPSSDSLILALLFTLDLTAISSETVDIKTTVEFNDFNCLTERTEAAFLGDEEQYRRLLRHKWSQLPDVVKQVCFVFLQLSILSLMVCSGTGIPGACIIGIAGSCAVAATDATVPIGKPPLVSLPDPKNFGPPTWPRLLLLRPELVCLKYWGGFLSNHLLKKVLK